MGAREVGLEAWELPGDRGLTADVDLNAIGRFSLGTRAYARPREA